MDLASLSKFPFSDIDYYIVHWAATALLLIALSRLILNELRRVTDTIKSRFGEIQTQHVMIALTLIQVLIGLVGLMFLRR